MTLCQQVAPVTPVTVVLDGVREPGNLGAILRTVAAIGAHNVVLMKGYGLEMFLVEALLQELCVIV